MTRGPRRLKDDPDFQWETGCDLGDEDLLVGNYDLPKLRDRIVAAAATAAPLTVGDGPPPVRPGQAPWRGWVRPVAAVVAGAALLGGAYWLGAHHGGDTPAPMVQTPPPVVAPVDVPQGPVEVLAPGTADEVPQAAGPTAHHAPAAPEEVGGADPEAADLAPAGAADEVEAIAQAAIDVPSVDAGTADAPDVGGAAPSSDLRAQQDAYERARAALEDGRYGDARDAFSAQIRRWPGGALAVEAQMGLLQALYGTGDAEATLHQAEKLGDLPAFARRSEEIARLRAESLVKLNRCEEALLVSEQLSSRGAADIRKVCRRKE